MKSPELLGALSPNASGALLERAGYVADEIADLHASGIIAIDPTSIPDDDLLEILGSDPSNLLSPNADWSQHEPIGRAERTLLVDFYTGGRFRPLRLRPIGVFGCGGLPPPLGPVWFERQAPFVLRSRFNRIVVREIVAREQLEHEVCRLTSFGGKGRVFFRGQIAQYFVQRAPRVAAFLYGDENVREPSLPSAAFRKRFSYVSAERHWKAFIAAVDSRLTGFVDKRHWVEDSSESVFVSNGHIARWHRISTMSLAQHYGLPTYGLDVTTSLDMAWWFATNKFNISGDAAWYTPHAWGDLDPAKWPVIYVFRCTDWDAIDKLDLPAERPRRQSAVLAHGSWGVHGNIVADDLVAVLVLAPSVGIAPAAIDDVFLLRLKARLGKDHPFHRAAGLEHVFKIARHAPM